jgi:hypothetical protein
VEYSSDLEAKLAAYFIENYPFFTGDIIRINEDVDDVIEASDLYLPLNLNSLNQYKAKHNYAAFHLKVDYVKLINRSTPMRDIIQLRGDIHYVIEEFRPVIQDMATYYSDKPMLADEVSESPLYVWSGETPADSIRKKQALSKFKYFTVIAFISSSVTFAKIPPSLVKEMDMMFDVMADRLKETLDEKLASNILSILKKSRSEIRNKYISP